MSWTQFAGSGVHTWLMIAGVVFLIIMVIRAYVLAPMIPEDHPDAITSMDMHERGWDEWDAHQAQMNARAHSLGYERGGIDA
ncbi:MULTISPECIES: hypothetical protein [unclassified Microbacterium]|uniref:hypothetical protein n=1 Tax=unclassified Microbacterium TaxID=2609290 RepID=UPI00386EEA86